MENVAGELLSKNFFNTNLLILLLKIQTVINCYSLMIWASNLGNFGIFNVLFPLISGILQVVPHNINVSPETRKLLTIYLTWCIIM